MRRSTLRRRYGHSSDGTFVIEQSGGLFLVKLTRPVGLRSGKEIPAGKTLGTINERGTISVWRSAGYNPRGYSEAARSLLDAARSELKSSGRIMAKQRARETAEEQATGSFIVKVGGVTRRFHEFKRANDWAESHLNGMPNGVRAEFFRGLGEGATPRTGMPWDVPFHILEKNEYGRIVMGSSR